MTKGKKHGGGKKRGNPIANLGKHAHPKKHGKGGGKAKAGKMGKQAPMGGMGMPQ